MPASYIEDLIDGARLRRDANGMLRVRVFYVDGLTPGTGALYEAMNAIPVAYGDADPDNAGLSALKIEPMPFRNSQTQAIVTVRYRPPDLISSTIVEFDGIAREVETNFDKDHNRIWVKYGTTGDLTTSYKPITGQVIATKACGILTVERTEFTDPTPRLVYLNKLNSGTYFGQPKWTWLVRSIQIKKALYDGSGFRVRYTLEYDEETHVKIAVWRDAMNDIPNDIENTVDRTVLEKKNGYTTVLVNDEIDFSGLSLPGSF